MSSVVASHETRKLSPEKTGQGSHAGEAGASFGVGVVIRVGVDIVCVDRASHICDELDAGDLDVVLCEKYLVAALKTGINVVNNRELRTLLVAGRAERVA